MELLAEVICWSKLPRPVPLSSLRDALSDTGFPVDLARDLLPRHAFTRASKSLAQKRIIRKLEENEDVLTFQLTQEVRGSDRFEYDFETYLYLNKKTGTVRCDDDKLREMAQGAVDNALQLRTSGDITQLCRTIISSQSKVTFPIRQMGGAYLIPAEHGAVIESLERLLKQIGVSMVRFPIPKGSVVAQENVREVMKNTFAALISKHSRKIAGLGDKTRGSTVEREMVEIQALQMQIEGYGELLASEAGRLLDQLGRAKKDLESKLMELMAA